MDKTVQLLKTLKPDGEKSEWSLTELSNELQIPFQTVYRLLSSLENYGIVFKNQETKKYSLSLKLITFESLFRDSLPLWQLAKPILKKMVKQTGETVFLTVKEGMEGVIVGGFFYDPDLQEIYLTGKRTPINVGMSQKVILAFINGNQREKIMTVLKGNRKADFSNELLGELNSIKEKGYAITDNETHYGTLIAAPIFSWEGEVVASITMIVRKNNLVDSKQQLLISLIKQAAQNISEEMGWIKNNFV